MRATGGYRRVTNIKQSESDLQIKLSVFLWPLTFQQHKEKLTGSTSPTDGLGFQICRAVITCWKIWKVKVTNASSKNLKMWFEKAESGCASKSFVHFY